MMQTFTTFIASVTCVAASALAAGCAPSPYADGEADNEPVDTRDGPSSKPGDGATTSSGSSSSTSGGTTSSSGTSGGTTSSGGTPSGGTTSGGPPSGDMTLPAPTGDTLIMETFDGALAFQTKAGTLTVVAKGANQTGRICADGSGIGHIEASIGPVSPGTYTLHARVQQDTAAPGRTWAIEATSWAPGPDTRKAQGDLAATMKVVTSTVQVSGGAFAASFAVKLGAPSGTCMLVDDIRVTKQ